MVVCGEELAVMCLGCLCCYVYCRTFASDARNPMMHNLEVNELEDVASFVQNSSQLLSGDSSFSSIIYIVQLLTL